MSRVKLEADDRFIKVLIGGKIVGQILKNRSLDQIERAASYLVAQHIKDFDEAQLLELIGEVI